MIKTIFCKPCDEKEANCWLNDKPHKEWFELNILYEPNGNIRKRTTITAEDNKNYWHTVIPSIVEDTFYDFGIIRRIGLIIS